MSIYLANSMSRISKMAFNSAGGVHTDAERDALMECSDRMFERALDRLCEAVDAGEFKEYAPREYIAAERTSQNYDLAHTLKNVEWLDSAFNGPVPTIHPW